ncbi:MAG: 4-hydroxy-3-methylbut-2-en-1-yl diphosphate synthase [Dysgonamonadaceae bacterium]|jgi:(E)-4-hydroxy-3-methylbut-2-enyl-diphosphate synthase|nr:4-hydroxy-3-methylbut-2-en-1-yl diphosphate synthase [Dysgonamonadaceae bacterium]
MSSPDEKNPLFNYKRRNSQVVAVGHTLMGGDYPVRLQSMTNTATLDTQQSIAQCIRIIEAGAAFVRLTAQGIREAENLRLIRDGLRKRGCLTPLIADIHFNPKVAEAAAQIVEKVRINPGNFVDPVKTFKQVDFSDEAYALETAKIRSRLIPFLEICKQHHTAIRIGVNHGSLSDRIVSRYGDTPQGMVESCMEFLRICREQAFDAVVVSIKASSVATMVCTVRLLVNRMETEGMAFPIHLGVTEAGEGEDGRVKSAVGIGTLLMEGIGDTIRVSLSEDPEREIPIAQQIIDYVGTKTNHPPIDGTAATHFNPFSPVRRKTFPLGNIGGTQAPVVIASIGTSSPETITADYFYIGKENPERYPDHLQLLVDYAAYLPKTNVHPLFDATSMDTWKACNAPLKFISLHYRDLTEETLSLLKQDNHSVILLACDHLFAFGEQKAFIHRLMNEQIANPVVMRSNYSESDIASLRIKSAIDCGVFFLDKLADGIWLHNNHPNITPSEIAACSLDILQATGRRISKTEYISCPGCGRTLFDLQATVKEIKNATGHLKGLKIGIMGCIVNGPGEMADADYGYVGTGKGMVALYKGNQCIEKNIPAEEAVSKLINVIKNDGDW